MMRWWKSEGTEIIEFAVSLPLLVVLVVGIYDFGSAFTVKHKLNNAIREGARIAIRIHPPDPSKNDQVCGGAPSSICVVRDVVANNLQTSIGNDCGLGAATASASSYSWTFEGTCSGSSLKIDSGVLNTSAGALSSPFDSSTYQIDETKITLAYPYQWQFNRAFKLLSPSADYFSSTITVSTSMQNID